jgi:hypothetical protein
MSAMRQQQQRQPRGGAAKQDVNNLQNAMNTNEVMGKVTQLSLAVTRLMDIVVKLQADLNDLSQRIPDPKVLQSISALLSNHDTAIKGILNALSTTQ